MEFCSQFNEFNSKFFKTDSLKSWKITKRGGKLLNNFFKRTLLLVNLLLRPDGIKSS